MNIVIIFLKSVFSLFKNLNIFRFIMFNYKRSNITKDYNTSVVLIEFTQMQSVILASSLWVRALSKKYRNVRFIAYTFDNDYKYWPHLRLIYKSFGVEIEKFEISKEISGLAIDKIKSFSDQDLTNDKLVRFKIDGVMIGDVIYDHHLRHNRVATFSASDRAYQKTLLSGLERFFFFKDYFEKNTVKAIHVSHQCYFDAIPLRVGVNNNIDVINCHESWCQRYTKERYWHNFENKGYQKIYNLLDEEQKVQGLKWAKSRIKERFSGSVGVDIFYSKKSAFYEINKNYRAIRKSDKIKVFIPAHCFFDAPNGSGLNLFPDYYIWLSTLGDISNKTDYDWYIKTHPDFIPGNNEILNEIVRKYPRIKVLDQKTSHKQIVHDGIDFVLTVSGTVGFEYAAMGVTVVNASLQNPHIGYDFNIHPKTKNEYIDFLLNLSEKSKISIDINQVYEYYYMAHNYFNTSDWLIFDFEKLRKNDWVMSSKIYGEYIESMKNSEAEMNKRLNVFNEFVMGDDDIMTHHGYRN